VVDWLEPIGEYLTREERRTRYGGSLYGGIEPSGRTPNVFLYSDPTEGETYGYNFDGWNEEGTAFLYTGEGQVGDQLFRDGNKAVANHEQDGRTLRLFVADGVVEGSNTKNHRYIGAFRIDPLQPHLIEEAPDRNGDIRTVIVFRLLPVTDAYVRESDRSQTGEPSGLPQATLVDAEAHETPTYEQAGGQPTTAIRVESELVARYKDHQAGEGQTLRRWKIVPPGEVRPLFTDLYDTHANELLEAKGTATRLAIRQAIGQLYDYRRHIPVATPRLGVLLPHRPSDDLLDLLRTCTISCIYETDRGVFERVDP
jgi:5-methylcytosine-specific restriction protein A